MGHTILRKNAIHNSLSALKLAKSGLRHSSKLLHLGPKNTFLATIAVQYLRTLDLAQRAHITVSPGGKIMVKALLACPISNILLPVFLAFPRSIVEGNIVLRQDHQLLVLSLIHI